MKVILSRKGFDSATWGYPSPYFIEDSRLLSFPIPEENINNSIDTGITYSDLRFNEKLSYLDIMKHLGINKFDGKYVHHDPDINSAAINNRDVEWRGLFGQCSSAQAHLNFMTIKLPQQK